MTDSLLTVADVAAKMDWPVWKTRRWLLRAGALRLHGGRWVTTPARLAACFPEAFEALALGDVEPHDADCASCADLRATVAELEGQVVELATRLAEATEKNGK